MADEDEKVSVTLPAKVLYLAVGIVFGGGTAFGVFDYGLVGPKGHSCKDCVTQIQLERELRKLDHEKYVEQGNCEKDRAELRHMINEVKRDCAEQREHLKEHTRNGDKP